MNTDPKSCETCSNTIPKRSKESRADYAARRYCSVPCSVASQKSRRPREHDVHRPVPPSVTPSLDRSWAPRAACRDADPELFFHPDGERDEARASRDRQAKAVCSRCPVIVECLRWALAADEKFGVFGGLTEGERAALRQRHIRS